MKARISAFALLAFVAASTVPMATSAQAQQTEQSKKKSKPAKKTAHKVSHKKKAGGKKMKKPSQA